MGERTCEVRHSNARGSLMKNFAKLIITGFAIATVVMLSALGISYVHDPQGFGASSASSVDPKEVLLRDVKLTTINWSRGGSGSIMTANFAISNPTQYRFKDFEIKCIHTAPSGTVIDGYPATAARLHA